MLDSWPPTWPPLDGLQVMARDLVPNEIAAEYVFDHAIDRALTRPPHSSQNVRGWFRRTMSNALIDWLRAQPRQRHTDIDSAQARGEWRDANSDSIDHLLEMIRGEVEALAPLERAVVELYYWDGQTVAAVARQLKCSASTVERTKASAVAKLRRSLGGVESQSWHSFAGLAFVLASGGGGVALVSKEPVSSAGELSGASGTTVNGAVVNGAVVNGAVMNGGMAKALAVAVAAVLGLVALFSYPSSARATGVDDPTTVDRADLAAIERDAVGGQTLALLPASPGVGTGGALPRRASADTPLPLAEAVLGSFLPGSQRAREVAEPDASDDRSSYEVFVTNRGVPVHDLAVRVFEMQASGAYRRIKGEDFRSETVEAGRVRVEFPLSSRVRHLGVSSGDLRFVIRFDRSFGLQPQTDTFALDLTERSFEPNIKFDFNEHESPGHLQLVSPIQPGVWFIAMNSENWKLVYEPGEPSPGREAKPQILPPYEGVVRFPFAPRENAELRMQRGTGLPDMWQRIEAEELSEAGPDESPSPAGGR